VSLLIEVIEGTTLTIVLVIEVMEILLVVFIFIHWVFLIYKVITNVFIVSLFHAFLIVPLYLI